MDTEKKTFWQYQGMVWSRAARRVWDKVGMLGTLVGFAASIIADVFIRQTQSRTDVYWGDIVTTASFFLGLCVIAWALYVAKEPVIVHNELAQRLDRWEGKVVRANIELVLPDYIWETARLSIPVINHEIVGVEKCFANIDSIVYHQFSDHQASLPTSSRNLSWETVPNEDGYITLEGTRRKILNVIKPDGDHFSIMYSGETSELSPATTQVQLPAGKYEIEIGVYGEIDGKPIEPVKKSYVVELKIIDPKDAKTQGDIELPYRMLIQAKNPEGARRSWEHAISQSRT